MMFGKKLYLDFSTSHGENFSFQDKRTPRVFKFLNSQDLIENHMLAFETCVSFLAFIILN